ncbi:MAG: HEAT repeat domain-containing protein [Sedimentisphaerales bacterium]|nr:HEAT repeat domain-containing protein [Sedimentisphaerales bacterium]
MQRLIRKVFCLAAPGFLMIFLLAGCQEGPSQIQEEDQSPVVSLIARLLPESPEQKVAKIQKQLLSPDADIRREGVVSLEKKDYVKMEVTPRILRIMAIQDPDPQVRAAAVGVLSRIDDDRNALLETLKAASTDTSALVRMECIFPLSRHDDEAGQDILLDMLNNDTSSEIRTEVAAALRFYNSRKVVYTLLAGLTDLEFGVSYQSRESLKELTGQDFGYDQGAWKKWIDKNFN